MKERDLAEQFLRDHVLAARALVALKLNQRPDGIRSRVNQAIANGTGFAELRTRIGTGETELVLRAGRWDGATVVDSYGLAALALCTIKHGIHHPIARAR